MLQLKILVRGYSQEIEWRDEHYVPETIDKHLEISRVTVGSFQLACSSFVGMGDIITKEVLDWLLTYPELLKCFTTFVQLSNDNTSTEVFLCLDTSLCIFYTLQYQKI
jgi:beta-farnesene synthase